MLRLSEWSGSAGWIAIDGTLATNRKQVIISDRNVLRRENTMVVDQAKIARLEKELGEARRELLKEDGERYRILMRDIGKEEKDRILGGLTDKGERILFGLETPEERRRGAVMRPGGAGGDLTCTYCGKTGLTKRGLGLHVVRLHKSEIEKEKEGAA
jgi:hypothetical protein